MSHYTTLILFNAMPKNLQDAIAEKLAPYDEEMNVPEYEAVCYCVKKGKAKETCGYYTEEYCSSGGTVGERFEDGSGCGGTGKYRTTYNPNSKWDWWVIGGRWEGDLDGSNSQPVSEILEYEPFAIVTPDGKWHEKGKMGWWAAVTNEDEGWSETATALLQQYKTCVAVLCDLHI